MLHLLPELACAGPHAGASTTTTSTPERIEHRSPRFADNVAMTPRAAKGLRKQIREDVADVVRGEYEALHLLLEERLQRMEQIQRESMRNQVLEDRVKRVEQVQRDTLREKVLEDRLQRVEQIQREAIREQADLITESVRKYEKVAGTMPKLLPAAPLENCKLSEFASPRPQSQHQTMAPELQLPEVEFVSPLEAAPDPGPSAGSVWSKNVVTNSSAVPSGAQVHPAPSSSPAAVVKEKTTKTAVEEEPEPPPCQPVGATPPAKRNSGNHGIQALAGASGWAKASAEEEQEQDKLRSMRTMTLKQTGFCKVPPEFRRRLLDIVLHPWFDFASGVAILSNALFMGIKTQVLLSDAKHGEASSSEDLFTSLEKVFAVVFIIEWLLRVGAYQRLFFSTKERAWHVFDTVLILASVVEFLIEVIAGSDSSIAQGGETMILRVLRIIRLMRLLRIVRFVSAFRELRLLISGLLGSTRSLLWSVVLLGFVVYLFGIFFEQGVLSYITENNKKEGAIPRLDELIDYFGSIQATMTTMFAVISGGEDWMTVMSPLAEISGFYTFAFIMYIFLTTNGILHVIVGIFVESTMAASRNDKDLVIADELARKDSYMAQMTDVLRETDSDESGTISWEEFESHLTDPRVIAYFAALELDVGEARGLFELLDTEESNEVPIDEFVVGCFRLKGGAKGIDLAALMYENKKMMKSIRGFMHVTEEGLGALDQRLASLTQFLPKVPAKMQGNLSQSKDVPAEIS